jgi:hypothetical protein
VYSSSQKRYQIVGLIVGMLLCVVSGCQPDPIKEFIQDTWYYNSLHLQGIAAEQHLEVFWTFAGDEYETESCCFNGKTYERGNYQVLSRDANTCIVELYNREGHIAGISLDKGSTYQVQIFIDEANDTLKIGRAVYTRWQGP